MAGTRFLLLQGLLRFFAPTPACPVHLLVTELGSGSGDTVIEGGKETDEALSSLPWGKTFCLV